MRATMRITNASGHNLKHVSVNIPHHQLIVVTGVSGSGKSSLAFDVIAREGQRRYLETFSAYSRQFMQRLAPAEVERIEQLPPVIALAQSTGGGNSRSTVGTLTDLYDYLRLLFARIGNAPSDVNLSRSLFSFNSPQGACPTCNGIGKKEEISVDKLITDPRLSLREGVLAPTLPTGYIMYSQVTIEVLDTVCKAHGFDVDTPWNQLTTEQQDVVLNGSTRLKVPFGKHSLESRLKWTGITAKPREEGHYKGLLTIMSDILKRDRNANILKYAHAITCPDCKGHRLNTQARQVTLQQQPIHHYTNLPLHALAAALSAIDFGTQAPIANPIIEKMDLQLQTLCDLGMDHLTLHQPSSDLSAGEMQRLRLVNQISAKMSDVLYVFDEPSIGLHPTQNTAMIRLLRQLVNHGNTVLVVEHDEATIRAADWIIDIGPKAGNEGGEVIYNGPLAAFLSADLSHKSKTHHVLTAVQNTRPSPTKTTTAPDLLLQKINHRNLQNSDVSFRSNALNVVTGVSGSGKSALVHEVLAEAVAHKNEQTEAKTYASSTGFGQLHQCINISRKPIGRTPRSNPATYTGMADAIRDVFAKTEAAKSAGFKKSHFSFNTKGGRCETCLGAGYTEIGMHFLGNIAAPCPTCDGKRFKAAILEIQHAGKSIFDIYEMSVNAALGFFADHPKIKKTLQVLSDIGLGYLTLGQPSSTLSGGEAQRVKLATHLALKNQKPTLFILDEPTTGLHISDIKKVVATLQNLCTQGHTVVCIEHEVHFIRACDWAIDLGLASGANGGKVVYQGPVDATFFQQSSHAESITPSAKEKASNKPKLPDTIHVKNATTHHLKNITAKIPKRKITAITGRSGSGKSSFAFHTLYREGQARFAEGLHTYQRSLLKFGNRAQVERIDGLGPVVAINRHYFKPSLRSTVGTLTGLYDHYRLLYARTAALEGKELSARAFSFNHKSGACPHCEGLGTVPVCAPEALISHPSLSITDGALQGSKTGLFYGDPHGQYVATLLEAANVHKINTDGPYSELSEAAQQFVLYGTGNQSYNVTWHFKNKSRSGTQQLTTTWPGFCNLVNEAYQRKKGNKSLGDLPDLMRPQTCPHCIGARLQPEPLSVRVSDRNIAELCDLTIAESIDFFAKQAQRKNALYTKLWDSIRQQVIPLLHALQSLGLGHLQTGRASTQLSGGELQRIRLAGQLSANLYGVTYILDEPTVGLHQKDTHALMHILRNLTENGNTVVVVEHDPEVIRQADYIIEFGPGAGVNGGEIVAAGNLNHLLKCNTPTARILRKSPSLPTKAHALQTETFGVKGAFKHHLKNIDVQFPLSGITAISGVSGSGKSTLLEDVVCASAQQGKPIGCQSIYGFEIFEHVHLLEQQGMSGTLHSTPLTFSGIMDTLRNLFASLPEARQKGLKKSAFSHNHKSGYCTACKGTGKQITPMDLMGNIVSVCESCNGLRYNDEVLAVTLHGKNIGEVLQMTLSHIHALLQEAEKPQSFLEAAQQLGIGHLPGGQPLNTVSAGEAQRLRIAEALTQHNNQRNLYLLDEPGTGLHDMDVVDLTKALYALAAQGHTIVMVEHHPYLIAAADLEVRLGPASGVDGGAVIHAS